jgi:organic hydroperoxide reductase OsmC/OhrA
MNYKGPTKENIPTSLFATIHSSCTNQTLHTQPGVTYVQITKQNSCTATNTEQDPHKNQPRQQTNDTQDLRYDEKPFRANGNYAIPPHTLLTKLK